MHWLDEQMEQENTDESSWNDHWNNHLRFGKIMEAYLTLCYSIKYGDIGLLQKAMQEVCIILQAPSANKPKYAQKMLWQLYIIDSTAADPILQKAYLANALVNLQGSAGSFYKMNLLFEHQNGAFKRFWSDRGSSLQETDQTFKQHALSVDTLDKVRRAMNRVVIGREKSGYHPKKDALFDIISLADQLYQFRSTTPDGSHRGKIYFSENPMPDLVTEGIQTLGHNISVFNESLEKNKVFKSLADNTSEVESGADVGNNKNVNEIFLSAQETSSLISDLTGILL